jgi:hypothetical protein
MRKVFPGQELEVPAEGPIPLLRFNEDYQATEEDKEKRIVICAAIERHPVPDINNEVVSFAACRTEDYFTIEFVCGENYEWSFDGHPGLSDLIASLE